jgi:hypothetical protein
MVYTKTALFNPKKTLGYILKRLIQEDQTGELFLSEKELREVLWLHKAYKMIDDVPGHIIELGVGPGTNAIRFGNLINLYGDKDIRMYYGFDTFEGYTKSDLESSPYLDSEVWTDLDPFEIRCRLEDYGVGKNTELIEGDLVERLPEWIEEGNPRCRSPGNLHVALLYVDCNSYRAALAGMEELYEYMSPGSIICTDQLTQGGEIRALREFCQNNDLEFNKGSSPIAWAPYTVVD